MGVVFVEGVICAYSYIWYKYTVWVLLFAVYIALIHPEAWAEGAASEPQRLMDGFFINLAPLTQLLTFLPVS